MNSIEILDLVRRRANLDSDRKVAKAIDMDQARVSAIRTGRRKIDGPMAIKMAELIGVPAAYILALIAAERAEDEDVAREWRRAARLLKKSAAAALLACSLLLAQPEPAGAYAGNTLPINNLTIMRIRRWLAGAVGRGAQRPRADLGRGWARRRCRADRAICTDGLGSRRDAPAPGRTRGPDTLGDTR